MSTTNVFFNPLRPKTNAQRRTVTGYIFIMPFILGFLFWFLAPALTAVWLTFTDWNLIRQPRYVGMENIQSLGSDPLFWQALKVTTIFTVVDHVVLRPLPYPAADRLFEVQNGSHTGLDLDAFEQFRTVEMWAAATVNGLSVDPGSNRSTSARLRERCGSMRPRLFGL